MTSKIKRKKKIKIKKNIPNGCKNINPKLPKVRKPYRLRKGTKAAREMKKAQNSTGLLIRKKPLQEWSNEILHSFDPRARLSQRSRITLQTIIEYLSTCRQRKSILLLYALKKRTQTRKILSITNQLDNAMIV